MKNFCVLRAHSSQVSVTLRLTFIMHNEEKENCRNSPRIFLLTPPTYFCVTISPNRRQLSSQNGGFSRFGTYFSLKQVTLFFHLTKNQNSLNYGHFPAIYDQLQKCPKDSTILHLNNLKLSKISQRGGENPLPQLVYLQDSLFRQIRSVTNLNPLQRLIL